MSSRRSSAPRMRPWTRGRFARSSEAGDKPKSEGASRIDVHTESPRRVLAELGVRPRKGLGQHFLVYSRVAARHIAYAKVGPSDVVLEIGPGLGVLTRELVVRARRVIAIEADRRLAARLRRSIPEADVMEGDALKVEWPPFDVMASNLPYRISSPLTFRLLDASFDRAVLMYQWEFARRMVAKPGTPDYSRLSVGVYRRAKCEVLERVPRNAFRAPPRVAPPRGLPRGPRADPPGAPVPPAARGGTSPGGDRSPDGRDCEGESLMEIG